MACPICQLVPGFVRFLGHLVWPAVELVGPFHILGARQAKVSSLCLCWVISEWVASVVVETITSRQWVSCLFLVLKWVLAELWFILNLSSLNFFIPLSSFQMTTLAQVRLASP